MFRVGEGGRGKIFKIKENGGGLSFLKMQKSPLWCFSYLANHYF